MTLDNLCIEYQQGDERAFSQIYEKMHKLASHMAKGYSPTYGVSKEDLKQEAMLALWNCAKTWDRDKGIPFAAYAKQRMRWAVRNASKRKGQKHSVCREFTDAGVEQHTEAKLELSDLYSRLDEREKKIVKGLAQGLTQAEIGDSIGVTAARVSQLLKGMKNDYA